MPFWKTKQIASRKFVDLLWKSSAKWAAYDPPNTYIEVGDYGTVSKETGCFEREGNIFSTEPFKTRFKDHKANIKTTPEGQVQIIASLSAMRIDVSSSATLDPDQMAGAEFKGGWSFSRESGAVLIAVKCHSTTLPPDLNIKDLANDDLLKGKSLVINVTKSPQYALYLAHKGDSRFYVALCAQAGPGRASASTTWKYDYGTGHFQSDSQPDETFTVLFGLKTCDQPKTGSTRDSPPPTLEKDGVAALEDTLPPWGSLDDDGEVEEGLGRF